MAEKMESIGEMKEQVHKNGDQVSASGQDSITSEGSALASTVFSAEFEERIGERIAAEVERRFQSAKDKRWARLERQIGALKESQKSMGEGKSEKIDRKSQIINEDWLARKTHELLEAAGLSEDPEVRSLFLDEGYGPNLEGYVELLGDITEIALRRVGRPRGRAATVMQPTGGGTPEPDLRGDYELRRAKLRPGDINGLLELKREFRKKGLAIF